MPNTVIDAGQVLVGDRIRVTWATGDVMITREGVVADVTPSGGMYTEQLYSIGPSEDSVIELLDRPKPKIELPTDIGTVVEYQRFGADAGYGGRRVATRLKNGDWRIYGTSWASGELIECHVNNRLAHKEFTELLNDASRTSDFKVLFQGVAK